MRSTRSATAGTDFRRRQSDRQQASREGILPHLKTWLEAHDYPFEFTTEATINLADDAELLTLMQETGFFAIFVGIESPDTDTLLHMQKPRTRGGAVSNRSRRSYRAGISTRRFISVSTPRRPAWRSR
jgi:hypothetical protein